LPAEHGREGLLSLCIEIYYYETLSIKISSKHPIITKMTMTAAERSSIESARNVLSKLIPKDTLTPVLEYFARVIEWVDKPSGGLWSITLNAANVKLNVGDLLLFVISKDRVELTVPKEMKVLFPSESFKDFNPDVNSCSCCRFMKEPAEGHPLSRYPCSDHVGASKISAG
jgi:hypothetical protein